MKFLRLAHATVLSFFPLSGFTADGGAAGSFPQTGLSSETNHSTELITTPADGGDILSVGRDDSGCMIASYFFTSPPTREDLARRILEVMKAVDMDRKFIRKISARLQRNRTLNKPEFSLPLTDIDGTVYQFDFISDIDNRFYVINYTCRKGRD